MGGFVGKHRSKSEGSLEGLFIKALEILNRLESGEFFPQSREFRTLHAQCLETLTNCLEKTEKLDLFSSNESLEDVNTKQLKYMNLDFFIAKVIEKTPIDASSTSVDARLSVCQLSARKYIEFIFFLREYGFGADQSSTNTILDSVLPQGIQGTFNLTPLNKPKSDRKVKLDAHRRITKLMQAYEEAKYRVTQSGIADEEKVREAEKTRLELHLAKSWEALYGIVEELNILSSVATTFSTVPFQEREVPYIPSPYLAKTVLERSRRHDGPNFDDVKYQWKAKQRKEAAERSTKVEQTIKGPSKRLTGPSGEVKRPFIITSGDAESRRKAAFKNVFGTGQKLPTVTIEELVEKELKNRIRPGEVKPEQDEDDEDLNDKATMKARHWDEFIEEHARGSGNTLNRG